MVKSKSVLIRCPNCEIPFFEINLSDKSFTFLKWIGGSMKKTIVVGFIESFMCPRCGKKVELTTKIEKID